MKSDVEKKIRPRIAAVFEADSILVVKVERGDFMNKTR